MITCSACGYQNPDGTEYCDACGVELQTVISSSQAPTLILPQTSAPQPIPQ
ncbi:MAG: zinc-ribbon domain-containing protein, partial [Dolichospermum sp.]